MAQSYRRHQRSAFFLSQTQNIFQPGTTETMWCLKKMGDFEDAPQVDIVFWIQFLVGFYLIQIEKP